MSVQSGARHNLQGCNWCVKKRGMQYFVDGKIYFYLKIMTNPVLKTSKYNKTHSKPLSCSISVLFYASHAPLSALCRVLMALHHYCWYWNVIIQSLHKNSALWPRANWHGQFDDVSFGDNWITLHHQKLDTVFKSSYAPCWRSCNI